MWNARFPNNYSSVSTLNSSTGVASASMHGVGVSPNTRGSTSIIWIERTSEKVGSNRIAIPLVASLDLTGHHNERPKVLVNILI